MYYTPNHGGFHYRDCSTKANPWVFAEYQLDFVLSDSTLNPELSDNRRHMKAVWSVLGVRQISLLSSQLSVRGPGQSSTARKLLDSITAAQCVELLLSNVSIWMGDRQRKHCAQLPGEEIGGTLV